jgi:hypothetical protein
VIHSQGSEFLGCFNGLIPFHQREYFYGNLMWPETIKLAEVFKLPSMKFYGNLSSGSCTDTCRQMDRLTASCHFTLKNAFVTV